MRLTGNHYADGIGVPQGYAAAMKWYRKGADAGDPSCTFAVGLLYYQGHGVQQDMTEAIKWFQSSANSGDPDAMFYLGAAYFNGAAFRLPSDYAAALNWLTKSWPRGQFHGEQYDVGVSCV